MWDSPSALAAIGSGSIYVVLAASFVAALVGAVGTIASNRANDIITRQSAERIAKAEARAAEANARADEARAETAKTNERIKKMQEARRLTREQIEALDRLFRSEIFKNPDGKTYRGKKLRVSSVEDAEARMYAMEWQKLMESCGVDIYPTDGGFPSTCIQLSPDAAPLTLTVKSGDVHEGMQHLAHFERTVVALGIDMKVEYDPALQPDQGVLHVMRKRAE